METPKFFQNALCVKCPLMACRGRGLDFLKKKVCFDEILFIAFWLKFGLSEKPTNFEKNLPLKPNYFKKQCSLSSFLLTKGNNTDPNWLGVLSRLVQCI